MIVVMHPDASKQQVGQVVNRIREMGLRDHVIHGTDLTVVAVIGDDRKKNGSVLEQVEGVDRVMKILAPYKMAARETKKQRTAVRISDECVVGGQHVPVIAGPCSVESESQILETARKVRAAGAHALRGGAFKPRTNPYSFQGLAEEGLKLLAEARAQSSPVCTCEHGRTDGVGAWREWRGRGGER